MKYQLLFFLTLLLFLIVNASYFWEEKPWAFPASLLLCLFFLGLIITLWYEILAAINERYSDPSRLNLIGSVTILLVLIYYRPGGIINFHQFEVEDVLVAQRATEVCLTKSWAKKRLHFLSKSILLWDR